MPACFAWGWATGPKLTEQTLRAAAGTAVRTFKKPAGACAALDLRAYPQWAGAAAEGAVLGQYSFQDFKKRRRRRSRVCG